MNEWLDTGACDSRTFRNMLGSFMTGVTVVSIRMNDGTVRAFTANSFTSVSLDPPLVLVCLLKSSPSVSIFAEAPSFAISVLADGQRDVSNAFASCDPEVKAAAGAALAGDDVPFVQSSLAVMICDRDRTIDAGDHVILLGRVTRFQANDGMPLGYYRGGYVGIGPAAREIEELGSPLAVGGVLGVDQKVLLCRRPSNGEWEIPSVALAHGERHGAALHRLFTSLGVSVNSTVPYSLFQEPDEHRTTFIFSVDASNDVATGALADGSETRLFSEAEAPWTLILGEMKQALLKRYFHEMAVGQFGVYFDTLDGGSVVAVHGKPLAWSDWKPSAAVASSDVKAV